MKYKPNDIGIELSKTGCIILYLNKPIKGVQGVI